MAFLRFLFAPILRLNVAGVCLVVCLVSALPVLAGTSALELISINSAQTGSANHESQSPAISQDGRYVAFDSRADNLVSGDLNAFSDVFLRDRQTGITILVSINVAGTGSANGNSTAPTISDDGRYIAFLSNAGNMVTNDHNNVGDVFVRDMLLGTTTLASASEFHLASGNSNVNLAKISANGRAVLFNSYATDLTPNDTNGREDVFVRDLNAGVTRMVSLNSTGTASANNSSDMGAISADGRYVLFSSPANNIVNNDTNTVYDVFHRDVLTGVTTLISINDAGTASGNNSSFASSLSSDGRYAVFTSNASNLISNDGNGRQDLYVRDLIAGTTVLLSATQAGTSGNNESFGGKITPDGRYVVFPSRASNLVPINAGGAIEIYVRDRQTNTTQLVSINFAGTAGGSGTSTSPVISADGRYVAFVSDAQDLVPVSFFNGVTNDIYARDLQTQTTKLLSANIAGTGNGNGMSQRPQIGADGHYVAFNSNSNNLIVNDINATMSDVFAVDVHQAIPQNQLRFSVPIYNVVESGGLATITVNRVPGVTGALVTTYSTGPVTANPGSDYTPVTGTLNFSAGESSKTFTVPILEDSFDEATELISLSLSGNASQAVILIQDNDSPPVITVNDVSIVEGNSGVTYARFLITQTPASEQRTSVDVGTSSVTASFFDDYYSAYGRVTFEPGETTRTVDVAIIGDTMAEPDELFRLNLDMAVNATIGDNRGDCTIINDDSSVVYMSIEDVTFTEGDSGDVNLGFKVTLSAPSLNTVGFSYQVISGTATENVDYVRVFGAAGFTPGATTTFVAVPIKGDLIDEPDETFTMKITTPVNGIILRDVGTATIIDNDPEPSISINDLRVTEARSGTYDAIFMANLSAPSGKTVTFNYMTSDVTATAGLDYQPVSGTITFSPGEAAKPIAVQIQSDSLSETDEAFNLNVSNPANASLVRGQISCTITDYRVRVPADFDGDGKSDVSVFRSSEGSWYSIDSSNGTFRAVQFGIEGDRIVPADYDGDGKTDIAVFRPSTGVWYRIDSSTGEFRYAQFGSASDIPAAADYDGDGKADVAVFRPSTGFFYFLRSTDGTFQYFQWGQSGDLPLMGDYDADGKADFAVFRPSTRSFYIFLSASGTLRSQEFGLEGDKPIAADFDGDAKTDIAVYRPSVGAWYYLQSSDNALRGTAWGTSGDLPVAGEYDGDGKWDVAVFRPSTGSFYILLSTTMSMRGEQFGISSDIPVAAANVP